MNSHFKKIILQSTGADDFIEREVIQELWSGYGKILRVELLGSKHQSIVVKNVLPPSKSNHPRGWNSNLSHERKLRSYQVESAWYTHWATLCDESCKVPDCLAVESKGSEFLMVLEDLDASGFSSRKSQIRLKEIKVCLSWLANFHATFMGVRPQNLWKTGTYWHLATRPEELKILTNNELKTSALLIDKALKNTPYQTFVHGDAKLANFCFTRDGKNVAAVDFQYVGGGCGMKDVAYFLGSCLDEHECEKHEKPLLEYYFSVLGKALMVKNKEVDIKDLEQNWRALYPVAWTDFYRFLQGWSPGHWKIHGYSERLSQEVIAQLQGAGKS